MFAGYQPHRFQHERHHRKDSSAIVSYNKFTPPPSVATAYHSFIERCLRSQTSLSSLLISATTPLRLTHLYYKATIICDASCYLHQASSCMFTETVQLFPQKMLMFTAPPPRAFKLSASTTIRYTYTVSNNHITSGYKRVNPVRHYLYHTFFISIRPSPRTHPSCPPTNRTLPPTLQQTRKGALPQPLMGSTVAVAKPKSGPVMTPRDKNLQHMRVQYYQ